ncbi:MAG: VOC family protein [Alphaproteobacteria bacterium]|nr:VOC family protein [Alphaproteobacteria bacterium]
MDHISIPVTDPTATRDFYAACLTPLGWRLRGFQPDRYVGFHKPGAPVLYFNRAAHTAPVHLAFTATDPAAVRAFHDRALAAGGADNGAPGPRPDYGPRYFAAFVLDPDGHNVEAVLGGVRDAAP